MYKATDARKATEEFITKEQNAIKEKATKWCEQNASYDIEHAANQGESTISYRLQGQAFSAEYRAAIIAVLKEAGYEVEVLDGQGCFDLVIDW